MNNWLLLLGSNRNGAAQLPAALRALAKLGKVRQRTPIASYPADGKLTGHFHNALATVQTDWSRDRLDAHLKQIESALGRKPGPSETIPIDIDILACQKADGWHYDHHALTKQEHLRPLVQELLQQAGITPHC